MTPFSHRQVNLESSNEVARNSNSGSSKHCSQALLMDTISNLEERSQPIRLALVDDSSSKPAPGCDIAKTSQKDPRRFDIADDYKHVTALDNAMTSINSNLKDLEKLANDSQGAGIYQRYIDTPEGKRSFKCQLDKHISALSSSIEKLLPELEYAPQAKDISERRRSVWEDAQQVSKTDLLPMLKNIISECGEPDSEKYDQAKREAILAVLSARPPKSNRFSLDSARIIAGAFSTYLDGVSSELIDLRERAYEKLSGRKECVESVPIDSAIRAYNRSANAARSFTHGITQMIPTTDCNDATWKENKKQVDQYFIHLEKAVARLDKRMDASVAATFPDGMPSYSLPGYEMREKEWLSTKERIREKLPQEMANLKNLLGQTDGGTVDRKLNQQICDKCLEVGTLMSAIDITEDRDNYLWRRAQTDYTDKEPESMKDVAHSLKSTDKAGQSLGTAIWRATDDNGNPRKWSKARELILPAVAELKKCIDNVHQLSRGSVLDDTNEESVERYTCLQVVEKAMLNVDQDFSAIQKICADLEASGGKMSRDDRDAKYDMLEQKCSNLTIRSLHNVSQEFKGVVSYFDSSQSPPAY